MAGKLFHGKLKIHIRFGYPEIMLQQTQVITVIPYYKKFVRIYPNIRSLAAASLDDLMLIWSGLGYYRRIRNIHLSAQIIAKRVCI
jgi:A/G-specific adenine glycosylase